MGKGSGRGTQVVITITCDVCASDGKVPCTSCDGTRYIGHYPVSFDYEYHGQPENVQYTDHVKCHNCENGRMRCQKCYGSRKIIVPEDYLTHKTC